MSLQFFHVQGSAAAAARRRREIAPVLLAVAAMLGLLGTGRTHAADAEPDGAAPPRRIRIGISPGMWTGVNRNDANAAITAWARTILGQRHILADVETQMFDTPAAMRQALKNGQVDAVSMLADQFVALDPELQATQLFLGTKNHSYTEQYELLVQQTGGITNVAGLAGRKVLLQNNDRTSLAAEWLDSLLAPHSSGSTEQFLGNLSRAESPSKAVLQVFFHQADACLVTSNVFELACELNPQLRKQLRVLALSPAVIPSMFFFRPDYASTVREQLEPAILELGKTPAGMEVLMVFQSDGMVKRPVACLDSTRQLLAECERTQNRPTTNTQTQTGSRQSLNQK